MITFKQDENHNSKYYNNNNNRMYILNWTQIMSRV